MAAPRGSGCTPLLVDLEHYPDWWPQVRAVAKLDDDHAWVRCRSTLPYTLDLLLTAIHREPGLLETTIAGDLVGSVALAADRGGGGHPARLRAGGRWSAAGMLNAARRRSRPLLAWNHARMMAGCLAGLRRALTCRRSP